MQIHQCMLHYLFKIILLQLNSTTVLNSVVLVEFQQAKFFPYRKHKGEHFLTNSSVYIITLTLNCLVPVDIFLCAENTFFNIVVIMILQNTKANDFHVNPSVNIITSSLSSSCRIFFYKLCTSDHHSLELLLYKGIKLINLEFLF